MEEALLSRNEEEEKPIFWRELACAKLKDVSRMAAPMVPVGFSQYLLRLVSMSMVGHLGQVALSGVALATSLTNVTGFSLLSGLAGALETLCGQANGAKQYRKLGSYTYSSMICLLIVCVPVSLLWIFMNKLLVLAHQDPQIADLAGEYSIWLIPSLFAYALFLSLVRYLQSQRLIFPLFLCSSITLCFHVPLCWVFVYKLGYGTRGAALSIGVSYWLYAIFLWMFTRFSSYCEKTRINASEVSSNCKEFLSLAVPSAVMVCLEWWSLEIVILLSGLLPNSKLETSILSICLATANLHYYIVAAISTATSTHVSNELGAGNPQAARATCYVSLGLASIDSVVVSTGLLLSRNVWGYIYSNEKEVLAYASEITPLLCLFIIVDSFLSVLCGIARGTGWQHFGAYINMGAYYLVGIPVGALLCFGLNLGAKGLLVGVMIGSILQSVVLCLMVFFTDWHREAAKARARIFERTLSAQEVKVA